MNLIVSSALLALLLLVPEVLGLFTSKHILCNRSIRVPTIDRSLATAQTISLTLCNLTFNAAIYPNERLLSHDVSIDARLSSPTTRHFAYLGHLLTEDRSRVSLILYPQLQIYIYLNGTYYYYLSLPRNNSVTLKFSQRQLLQYYPQLVNDSLWSKLQLEEDIYQQNSMILHDLHFIYELLTLRCDADSAPQQTVSFCSLALFVDRLLFEKAFQSNVYYLFTIIEHFNFLLRTFTLNEYGGFLIERLTLVDHVRTNFNSSFDLLHTLANNVTYALKNYCLAHQMLLSDGEKDNYVLGYQSSINTYDVGGICSSPFNINNNQSEEMNLNTGLSMFNENVTANMSMFVNGLMKTSYLFFRQMGLNLTLCSINATRRGFFQFNTQLAPAVQNCIELLSTTLQPALKRRAHLCFSPLSVQNWSSQAIQQQLPCQRSLELQSGVPVDGKNAKNSRLDSIMSDNRRSEWMEGNIVGMIITFSLIIWIPVSCFVHFCKDEINKKAFLEKQQQQELEALQMKLSLAEQTRSAKETQTE